MSFAKIINQLNVQGEPRNAIDPFVASLPQNILSGAVARQEQAFAEQVEEERRVAQDLHEREVAEAAVEYANSLYAKTERWREGPVPSAEELGVDVTDLAPARSELARFAAWVGQTRDQVRDLEAAREKFLTDLGAPTITEKALADLIAEDKSGFLAWPEFDSGSGIMFSINELHGHGGVLALHCAAMSE